MGNYGTDTSIDAHGFLYHDGVFTYFDYPGEPTTVPTGINDYGLIVGAAGKNPVVGFLYDGTTFTTLKDGSSSATYAIGINNSNLVVGGAGTIYATNAFEMRSGHYKQIDFPGLYIYGYASGINNQGLVAGYTIDGSYEHSFLEKNGRFRNIDIPGALVTEALAINDKGATAGWYALVGVCLRCGFVSRNGKYLSFQYPGADTYASGINDSGVVVGAYTFDYHSWHGFVTNAITAEDFR